MKNAGVMEWQTYRALMCLPRKRAMESSQRVPKGKPLEQKLAKTAKADTERRAKFWNTF